MSENTQPTADASDIDQLRDLLKHVDVDADSPLHTIIDGLLDIVGDLSAERDDLLEHVKELEQELADAEDRIEELETELSNYRNENEQDKAGTKRRVTTNEEAIATLEKHVNTDATEETPDEDADDESTGTGMTALEQIVQLPDNVAERELSKNQQRARKIAMNLPEYTQKVPAGHAITTSELATVMASLEGERPHRETRSRVLKFLNDFAGEYGKVVKRRGRKRFVLEEGIIARLERTTPGSNQTAGVTGVVTP
ncbi:hypothetical protein C475_08897 [Halosimplex carlsbadense 2-9-1]|uniref:Uncharacterized protein n=1 Tax=Halosimplex carlsbadense 2-9-1 TaxID=797114 RepID=M0CTL0_9EURY|nr:hypothetical protein [Halosimplex carlsbadense]ELZ26531.1 hypothetical protein C475_08897 [Halosimplex carlsbadense 2-9-1]